MYFKVIVSMWIYEFCTYNVTAIFRRPFVKQTPVLYSSTSFISAALTCLKVSGTKSIQCISQDTFVSMIASYELIFLLDYFQEKLPQPFKVFGQKYQSMP